MSDFFFVNHGSIHLLTPLTEAAKEWVAVNLPEDAQYFGKSVAIEPRYSQNILDGIADEGLMVT